MKEMSKREQKKAEIIRQENIQKLNEDYIKSRILPDEYKKKIRNRIIKNMIIAIISIIYLIAINALSLYIETAIYITCIKVLCILLAIICVIYFELSYRKDNGYLFLHGLEFLILAIVTLFSIYAYSLFFEKYNIILGCILIAFAIYYIIKTIVTVINMKKQYYKGQNDIKDIVKK